MAQCNILNYPQYEGTRDYYVQNFSVSPIKSSYVPLNLTYKYTQDK